MKMDVFVLVFSRIFFVFFGRPAPLGFRGLPAAAAADDDLLFVNQ
jgi:hypothetical protein